MAGQLITERICVQCGYVFPRAIHETESIVEKCLLCGCGYRTEVREAGPCDNLMQWSQIPSQTQERGQDNE